jgi:hypothetical protein
MNLREVTMKHGCLVVFIRHDSAETWGLKCGLTLVIGTLKLWPAPALSCVYFLPSNKGAPAISVLNTDPRNRFGGRIRLSTGQGSGVVPNNGG